MTLESGADGAEKDEADYFQELADGAPVMIWMSGVDMGCFYFNRAWLDYRGRTLEQEFGNGWADGVHPDDLDPCLQHYISCFGQRVPFAMSYRLQDHSGVYRWILDRGAPHYDTEGNFLGFYGGCAETSANIAIARIAELREALHQMREFAERIATAEAHAMGAIAAADPLHAPARRRALEHRARRHAAVALSKLADDMLIYDRIGNGARFR
jgi:PAS domain S-box-containing protein